MLCVHDTRSVQEAVPRACRSTGLAHRRQFLDLVGELVDVDVAARAFEHDVVYGPNLYVEVAALRVIGVVYAYDTA